MPPETAPIHLTWQSDGPALREAMTRAAQRLMGPARWWLTLASILVGLLVALGGAGMVLVVSILVFDQRDPGFLVLLAGSSAAMALFIYSQHAPWNWLVRSLVQSPYGASTQRAEANDQGITFVNDHTRWTTAWPAVTAIETGRRGIAIAVSGIAFAIPRAAFASSEDMAETAELMRGWREAAK